MHIDSAAILFSLDPCVVQPFSTDYAPSKEKERIPMMNIQGSLREAQRLRLRMQMDNRLRLEVLAALSRTFRENRERVSNDLLRSLVFAVPEELPGEGEAGKPLLGRARVPPQPGYAKKVPPQPGGTKKVPPQPGKAKKVPPQPGRAKKVPPQPGRVRRVPPQPGGAKRRKKSAKKSGKKR